MTDDDDVVSLVLDWHALFDFHSAIPLQQQSADRHMVQFWHIILIPSQCDNTLTIHRYSRSKRVDNIDIPCFCARTQQLSNLNTFFRFLCVLGGCYVLSIWVQKSYLKSSIAECILPEALNITIKRQNWIQNTNSESFSNMKFRTSNRLSQIKLVIFF